MRIKNTIGLILVICLISTLVMAESSTEKKTEQKDKKADVSAPSSSKPASGRPSRTAISADRQKMFKEMLARRFAEHQKAIDELKAIKKLAEEENAPRTAEAIQKMIDKKQAEFDKRKEQLERRGRGAQNRVQQRNEPSKTEKTKATEDK